MSVFRLQEWWTVKVADDEEFDNGCLILGNIDNSPSDTSKIYI